MGFDFTSGGLLADMIVSSIGFGFCVYGKRQSRFPQLFTGLAMMVYPMFVAGASACVAISVGLFGCMWLALRAGF